MFILTFILVYFRAATNLEIFFEYTTLKLLVAVGCKKLAEIIVGIFENMDSQKCL